MKTVWERFEDWLGKHAPDIMDALNTPANESDIERLEQIIGVTLPEDFKTSYLIHNGENFDSGELINREELLSVDRIIAEWSLMKKQYDHDEFDDSASIPAFGIKKNWWNPLWVPITYDGDGNYISMDLDPSEIGKVGQVIRYYSDSPEREILADSFIDWLSMYVSDLEDGRYYYNPELGAIVDIDELDFEADGEEEEEDEDKGVEFHDATEYVEHIDDDEDEY